MAPNTPDIEAEGDDLQRVLAAGVDWVGREYTRRLRESLRAMRDATDEASKKAAEKADSDDWVTEIVWSGEDLPGDVYFDVILAAIDETDGDDTLLWCIADGPVDHLMGRDLDRWGPRFHAERSTTNVDLMFREMQRSLRADGHQPGWWGDDASKGPRGRRRGS